MNSLNIRAALLAATVVIGLDAQCRAQIVVPAQAFAVLPARSPRISPDGTHFAVIREQNGRPSVAIFEIGSNKPPLIVTSDDVIVSGIIWVKSDVLIIYSKQNTSLVSANNPQFLSSFSRAAAVLINVGKQVPLSGYGAIVDIDLDDPNLIYENFGNAMYELNVRESGRPRLFMSGLHPNEMMETDRWFFDGHGKVAGRVDSEYVRDDNNPHWIRTLKVREGSSWRDIGTFGATVDRGDGVQGLSEDAHAFIRIASNGMRTDSVTKIDIASGAETPLFDDPTYDVDHALSDEWTGRIVGYAVDRDLVEYQYFDPKNEALQKGLEQAFPGLSVHGVSMDVAKDRIIASVVGPKTPPSYYLLDRATHKATALVASFPDLDESVLGDVKPYPYKARDGLEIPAYVTLPPGRAPKNLPLVVMPHGGPDDRDDMTFDWWSQFLANRGYAVFKPNFRGSSGYGRAYTEAGLKQWGLKMQDDISDGVNKLVADGVVDPKRVCIVGASYGGYAALAGAVFTPQLYACAVSYAGVSNLVDMLGDTRNRGEGSITNGSFWTTRIGDGFRDSEKLAATSPEQHADRVTAPILLMHSELDVTVPIVQSELMAEALKKNRKKFEFIRLPGDDHYLSLGPTRLRLLQETERFLKTYIGN